MTQTGSAKVEWNPEKKHWQVVIQVGAEVIRRQCAKTPQDAADPELRRSHSRPPGMRATRWTKRTFPSRTKGPRQRQCPGIGARQVGQFPASSKRRRTI